MTKVTAARIAGVPKLVRVAVPVPVGDAFDYLWAAEAPTPAPGTRVRVPFGRREKIGVVVEHPDSTPVERSALKHVLGALDAAPVVDGKLLDVVRWAADYYHHPLGEVLAAALPALLRKGRPAEATPELVFGLTPAANELDPASLARRAPRQARALEVLAREGSLTEAELRRDAVSADALKRLELRGLVTRVERAAAPPPRRPHRIEEPPELTPDQRAAVDEILGSAGGFGTFLLHGVTGSGKTEVFLRLIRRELDAGRQTLVLVPEIGLTPQLVGRLRARFGEELAVIHSGLSEGERLAAWRSARDASAHLIVGTRSAVFSPLPKPGLVVVDEEHDPSFKQQQGFRYSARDLAVVRARALDVPVVLASATPSLESFRHGIEGRYRMLRLPRRIGAAGAPSIRVIDMNRHASRHGLSTPLLALLDQHLARGNQVLLFINRRGFAPVLFCSECESIQECARCDARMTIHAKSGALRCHHCGAEKPLRWACPDCGAERIAVGAGTQRITEELESLYPEHRIARLDRDALKNPEALGSILEQIERGEARIIVGTQLLTKGHDFPDVTLVGVLNADQGLFGTDFRSEERLAQTIVQVAGRAGRRDRPGEVLIQTHYPGHPLLNRLLEHDYASFAEAALAERRQSGWPPYSHLAVWRAEATRKPRVFEFLQRVRSAAERHAADAGRGRVRLLGPASAPMERRGGRFRGLLVFQSESRPALHALIDSTLASIRNMRESRQVRWSIDVDPIEL